MLTTIAWWAIAFGFVPVLFAIRQWHHNHLGDIPWLVCTAVAFWVIAAALLGYLQF